MLGAAGAGLILLALRQVWAHAVYAPPHPFPAQDIAVSGQKLVPLASALAIAALACLAAVIATRGVLRRVAGGLLAAIGAGAAVAAAAAVRSSAVLSAATSADPTAGAFSGSATGGTTVGGTTVGGTTVSGADNTGIVGFAQGHAVMSGLPWQIAAVAGALAIVLAGLATVWRGTRWPVMSARFDRPGQRVQRPTADSATMWESLNRDVDPTDEVESGSGAR
ncbi:MAG TPA: Trp biosynthesis-associated membrane protein [Streptosporangiaceae bacterium]